MDDDTSEPEPVLMQHLSRWSLFVLGAMALVVSSFVVHRPLDAALDDLCTPPTDDVSEWTELAVPPVAIKVPKGFRPSHGGAGFKTVSAGSTVIGVGTTFGTDQPSRRTRASDATFELACETTIDHRPTKVGVLFWRVADAPYHDAPMDASTTIRQHTVKTPADSAGPHYEASVVWPMSSDSGMTLVEIWISARDRSELKKYRGVFWTARFQGDAAGTRVTRACAEVTAHTGSVADLVDTALVSMLAANSDPALPPGSATIEFSFDSTGGVSGAALKSNDLPAAAQEELASIVGSNIKPQPIGAPSAGVRVEIGATGLSYTRVEVAPCLGG